MSANQSGKINFEGEGLGKVEGGKRQGEKERKNLPSHRQQTNLARSTWMDSVSKGGEKKNRFREIFPGEILNGDQILLC